MTDAFDQIQITDAAMNAIATWLAMLVNATKIEADRAVTPQDIRAAIVRAIGASPTGGVFAAMTGAVFFQALARPKVRPDVEVPVNVEPIVTAFAATWNPNRVGVCSACGVIGVTMRMDRTGVDVATHGALCPHCGGGNVVVTVVQTTHTSWVTGRAVPITQTHDTTSEPGESIPLCEDGLRATTHHRTLATLDRHGVTLLAWATYLRNGGAAPFGGAPRASSMQVVLLLRRALCDEYSDTWITAQMMRCKDSATSPRSYDTTDARVGSPRGPVVRLSSSMTGAVYDAIVDASMCGSHAAFCAGIEPRFVASMPLGANAASTVMQALSHINGVTLTDGSAPIAQWLANVAHMMGQRSQRAVIERAIAALHA